MSNTVGASERSPTSMCMSQTLVPRAPQGSKYKANGEVLGDWGSVSRHPLSGFHLGLPLNMHGKITLILSSS